MAGEDFKVKKEYRFYILRRGDGRYVFKCITPQQRDEWTMLLNKVITVSARSITVEVGTTVQPEIFPKGKFFANFATCPH